MFILIFVISQSLHWRCVSAFPIAPVNPNLASLTCWIISDSCWFAFCFAYSVEKQVPEEQFIVFWKFNPQPPTTAGMNWQCSDRVLLCSPGRPHSNTSTKQIFDNSIIITKGQELTQDWHWSAVLAIYLVFEKWVTTVSIFHCLEPVVCTFKKPELYPAFHLTLTFLCQEKETTVIWWNLLQRYFYNNIDIQNLRWIPPWNIENEHCNVCW